MDENRHRHTVWMDDDVWDQVESHYQRDNCTTKNEFIEKAIRFYSGYLDTESADAYLPRVLIAEEQSHSIFVDRLLMRTVPPVDNVPPHVYGAPC